MTTTDIPQTHSLSLKHTVPAPRDRVFQAFTDAQELQKWWGPPGFSTPSVEIDLRVGGRYRLEMQAPDGERFYVKGTFRQIDPPARLVTTWEWEGTTMDGEETLVTIEFHDKGNTTEILLKHEGFADQEVAQRHDEGWCGCLSCLDDTMAAQAR